MDKTNGAAAAGSYAVPPPVPVSVPVAGAVVPVDFTVVKKRLGGAGGDMAVHDASGGHCGGGRALLDAAGGALVTIRRSGEAYRTRSKRDHCGFRLGDNK